MNESLKDVNTGVFGESNFDDVSNPLTPEELGENEHRFADFQRSSMYTKVHTHP